MSKIKFPPLHKALTKNGDLTVLSDYIYIKNYHAIILNPEYVLYVDLKTKFNAMADEDAMPDYDYENALDILEFLNDKLISGSYWEELVTAQAMMVNEEEDFIQITSKGSSKELHHVSPKEIEGDSVREALSKAMAFADNYATMESFAQPVLSINLKVVNLIATSSKSANDTLVVECLGPGRHHRVTFQNHRDVFGIIVDNQSINDELFLNHQYEQWIKSLSDDDVFGRVDWTVNEPELTQEDKDDLFSLEQSEKGKKATAKVVEMVKSGQITISKGKESVPNKAVNINDIVVDEEVIEKKETLL